MSAAKGTATDSLSSTQVADTGPPQQPETRAHASGKVVRSSKNISNSDSSHGRARQKSGRCEDRNMKSRGVKRGRDGQDGKKRDTTRGEDGEREDGEGASSKSKANPGWLKRKVFDGYHPGSYAGDLANKLSAERRRQLQEHQEREAETVTQDAAAADERGEAGGGETNSATKKKVALLIAYRGSNYQGLQINEGAVSVEAEVELALYLSGGISKDNFGNLRKVSWSRAGRTDKGVHAAAQVIVMKLTYQAGEETAMVERINKYLPEDIRVLGIMRTPKSFDAKDRCTGRRYEYIMPTYVLASKDHVAAVFAEALEWEKSETTNDMPAPPCNPAGGGGETTPAAGSSSISVDAPEVGSEAFNGDVAKVGDDDAKMNSGVELSSEAVVRRVAESLKDYRVDGEAVEALREVLNQFCGTRNYHNFTNNKKGSDGSCRRYITSFTASEPWESDGREWIRLTVTGQSFLLHQIRKMVAASVDRVRGHSSAENFMASFSLENKFNLGIAPSQGLYLERPFYDAHNTHVKAQGTPEKAMEWDTGPIAVALENFKKNEIQDYILAQEKADHEFVAWLDRITRFPCTYEHLTWPGAPAVQHEKDGEEEAKGDA